MTVQSLVESRITVTIISWANGPERIEKELIVNLAVWLLNWEPVIGHQFKGACSSVQLQTRSVKNGKCTSKEAPPIHA